MLQQFGKVIHRRKKPLALILAALQEEFLEGVMGSIYDALITERPYRKAISRADAIRILEEESQKGKLDADVVGHLKAFIAS